jgi:hypothetical protein
MKTKSFILSVVAVVLASTFSFAEPGNPKLVVLNQKESGVFKLIYEGTKAGKVSLKISDANGQVLFTESVNGLSSFIRPLNFNGMAPGEYIVEVADAAGKLAQTVNYRTEAPVQNVHVAKIANEGKYLLAVTNKGSEQINVKIFDGTNNLVHSETMTVNGNLGLVYNLKQVSGVPTFEVTDNAGNTKVITRQ